MVILGIHDGHNASAALIVNGELVSLLERNGFLVKSTIMAFRIELSEQYSKMLR